MRKNVLVTVKGTRRDRENDAEVIELVSPGTFHHKNNSYYIIYKETAIAGMENATTTIKAEGDIVTIIRNGSINMRQVFERDKMHRSVYQTTFGSMDMMVKPWNIEVDLTDLGGSIKLEYELELDHAHLGTNSLLIMVKEA